MLVALPSSIAFGVLVYSAVAPEYAGDGALAGILGAAALGIVAPLVGRNGGFITPRAHPPRQAWWRSPPIWPGASWVRTASSRCSR